MPTEAYSENVTCSAHQVKPRSTVAFKGQRAPKGLTDQEVMTLAQADAEYVRRFDGEASECGVKATAREKLMDRLAQPRRGADGAYLQEVEVL